MQPTSERRETVMATRFWQRLAVLAVLVLCVASAIVPSSGGVVSTRVKVYAMVPLKPTDKPLPGGLRVDQYGYIRNGLGDVIGIWGVDQLKSGADVYFENRRSTVTPDFRLPPGLQRPPRQ